MKSILEILPMKRRLEAEAIAAWNTRAPSSAAPLAIAALEEAKAAFESLAAEADDSDWLQSATTWSESAAKMSAALAAAKLPEQ